MIQIPGFVDPSLDVIVVNTNLPSEAQSNPRGKATAGAPGRA